MNVLQTFGKLPAGKRLERIRLSPHYKNGSFQNIEPTSVNPNKVPFLKLMRDYFRKSKTVKPAADLPFTRSDLMRVTAQSPTVTWFGHSSYLIQVAGITVLVDPVFSSNASPVSFFGKPFAGSNNYNPEDFPSIDLLLLTHDHYDHLDFQTIQALSNKVALFLTPLGLGAHLEHWGVAADKIVELDWWESFDEIAGLHIHSTPSRHFSGRGITRDQSLWTSYVLHSAECKLFIGGDSGYDSTFRVIGERFGPFDLAFLECGQYGKDWPQIHMFPEETVQAAKDLNADMLMPVHWSKFILSTHSWNEPIQRLAVAAKQQGQAFVAPLIGETYSIGQPYEQQAWWEVDENAKQR